MGSLRFKSPQPPSTNRTAVNDGSVGRMCPQASADNTQVTAQLFNFLNTHNVTTSLGLASRTVAARDPRESEDCLFLDVLVPQAVFERNNSGSAVLVSIYGKSRFFIRSELFSWANLKALHRWRLLWWRQERNL